MQSANLLSLTALDGFCLSNVLKPLPHACVTMQQLDTPVWLTVITIPPQVCHVSTMMPA